MHCGRFQKPLSRRDMLQTAANGFGAVALATLLADEARAAALKAAMAPKQPHYPAKVKSVIFLFMDGGPSQVDTFDPKPRLTKEHGQPLPFDSPPTQFNDKGKLLKSPWEFKQYGQSGTPVSDLFPHVATCIDDIAVVRSMTADFSEHTNANYFIHSGHGLQGRPSMGSWATYGLGNESRDLPGFIVLNSGMIPPGGLDCFNSGFLPATYQGSLFREGSVPISDLTRTEKTSEEQARKLALMKKLDAGLVSRLGPEDKVESAISNYELAFRMQSAVPNLVDLKGESQATQQLYGLDDPVTRLYGTQCLIARRLVERGVRFIELLCPNVGHDRWDQHSNLLKGHTDNARATDKPIAGLLKDLKSRGLLDDTLIVWGGEFGRTPMAQAGNGRDHNPFGFSMWLAGGGIKGGTVHGATDDYGYFAVQEKVNIHDLHATMLHLLGIDHKRLTYRYSGRDFRLTDVYGELIKPILA
jgi:hypothetical protein